MILGLKRGEVVLVPHQPGWAERFEDEKRLLTEVLGTSLLAIEHVGSTAVPGLLAKPVIDVAILVRSLDEIESWPGLLHPHGYACLGDREGRGDHFFAKGRDEQRTVYLHVVASSGLLWGNYLKFREVLCHQPQARLEYEGLKQQALEMHRHDRRAYTAAKDAWIQRVLAGEYDDHRADPQAGPSEAGTQRSASV